MNIVTTTTNLLFLTLFFSSQIYLLPQAIRLSSNHPNTTKSSPEGKSLSPSEISPGEEFDVFIINSLVVTKFDAKCFSTSDTVDLGTHHLEPGEYFRFKLKVNQDKTTLYSCYFLTQTKFVKRDVFDMGIGEECKTHDPELGNRCVWVILVDGFYLGNQFPPALFKKKYGWDG